jgi:thioredoxin-related protein
MKTNSISWQSNLGDACKIAEKENKPILVDWADLPSCVGCVSLENTTYPRSQVAAYINEYFIPVQLNQRRNLDLFKENKVIWTPTITACDASGEEQDRWVGYLPPEEFLPRVKFARARLAMSAQAWSEAVDVLEEIMSLHKNSFIAADALYWLGVVKWKVSKNFDDLSNVWTRVMEEYPNSEAAAKASCL